MYPTFRKTAMALAISFAAGSAALAAGQMDQQGSASFEEADRDNNGVLSFAEARESWNINQRQFAAADTDRSDNVSRSEYKQMRMQQDQQPGSQGGQRMTTTGSAAEYGRSGQSGMTIQVEEQAPQIQVTQPEPTITIEQPAPDIMIKQPPPEVSVQTPQPQVIIEEAQPQVTVKDTGQPQIEIERTGEVETQLRRTQPAQEQAGIRQEQMQADREVAGQPGRQLGDEWLSMRVQDLKAMHVENLNQEEIGDVDQVVIDPQSNRVYAVVAVGGLMGIGEQQVPFALDEMQLQGDKLVLPTSAGEDRLEEREKYVEARYRELDDNQLIGDIIDSGSATADTRFDRIDANNDGYISRDEAEQQRRLKERWDKVDRDSDQRIDRAEFSAFEEQGQPR